MKRFLSSALLALAAIVWLAGAGQTVAQDNSPSTEGGKRVGVDADVAALLAEKLGVKLELVVPESFGDLIPMVERGQIDVVMAGMSITFDRARVVDFTDPYFETGLSILANKGRLGKLGVGLVSDYDTLISRLKEKGRLEKKLVIAVTKGKSPEKVVPRFFPGAQVVAHESNEAAAEAVLRGEADIMVHDEMFLKVWLHDNAAAAQFVLTVFDRPFKPDYYGYAVAVSVRSLEITDDFYGGD